MRGSLVGDIVAPRGENRLNENWKSTRDTPPSQSCLPTIKIILQAKEGVAAVCPYLESPVTSQPARGVKMKRAPWLMRPRRIRFVTEGIRKCLKGMAGCGMSILTTGLKSLSQSHSLSPHPINARPSNDDFLWISFRFTLSSTCYRPPTPALPCFHLESPPLLPSRREYFSIKYIVHDGQ